VQLRLDPVSKGGPEAKVRIRSIELRKAVSKPDLP
jgi:hypothetical protein